jgi:hypothetical protein
MQPNGGKPMPETEPIKISSGDPTPPPGPPSDPGGGKPMPEGGTATP